jgi:hypothetical protein
MNQPSRAAINERERRCDQRMFRRSQSDFLGKRKPQHHSSLAVIRQAPFGRTVNEGIKIGEPPKRLARNRNGKRMIRRR